TGVGPRALLHGTVTLAIVALVVGGLSVVDSYTTPTILRNPIAQQLPPNVTLYAAVNIQQLFLLNTRRPLDAVMNALTTTAAPAAPAAPAASTTGSAADSTPAPANDGATNNPP